VKRLSLVVTALLSFILGYAGMALLGGSDQAPASKPVATYSVPSAETFFDHTDLSGGFSFDTKGERPLGDVPTTGGAEPHQDGCRTRLISNNTSARTATPSLFVEHYTVSPNRSGWDDMNAIWNWFNNPASQVSAHYIIDWEGNCYLIVPESVKAWTQGAFNSSALSIEFIATGTEAQSTWASKGDAGLRKGAKVTAASMKRWHIPLRLVDPVGCTVVAGYTDHNRLECDNSHHDVAPNFPWTKFKRYLALAYNGSCAKFQIREGKKVLAESSKARKAREKARLNSFLDARDDLLLKRLRADDGKVTLKRVEVVCG